MKVRLLCYLFLSSQLGIFNTYATRSDSDTDFSIGYALGYESKYATEGRNNLSSGGVGVGQLSVEGFGIEGGVTYLRGSSVHYDELNLSIGKTISAGAFDLRGSITYLDFRDRHESDWEIALEFEYFLLERLSVFTGSVFSEKTNGFFLNLGATAVVYESNDIGTFSVTVSENADFGYASPDHDGLNHIEISLAYHLPIFFGSLELFVSQSLRQKDVKIEGGDDLLWTGFYFLKDF